MRSFSREERGGQAKQSQLLQTKNKPPAAMWVPSISLTSPAWMKNIKQGTTLAFHEHRGESLTMISSDSDLERSVPVKQEDNELDEEEEVIVEEKGDIPENLDDERVQQS